MTIRLKIKDGATGKIIEMKLNPKTSIGDIIIDAADCFNKKSGAYLIKYNKRILLGHMTLADSGISTGSVLELLLDPEGG